MNTDPIYEADGKISVRKAVPFGLQHVLAMFVANIAPILIVTGVVKVPASEAGAVVQAAMIIAGIGSLLQMYPVFRLGSGLPVIMGISFTFVSVFCVIGLKYGYGAILGAVHKGAADGEYTVGLTWEDPAATYVKNGADVEVVFPKEGAIFPGESVQIIKGAKHMENAKKFVDFMLSQKIQEAAGKTLTVRPLRKGVKLADYMTPQDTIALFKNYDEGWVAAHKKEVVAEWNKHLENSRQ